jgi:hypothetical protein
MRHPQFADAFLSFTARLINDAFFLGLRGVGNYVLRKTDK